MTVRSRRVEGSTPPVIGRSVPLLPHKAMQQGDMKAIGHDYPVLRRYLGELRFAAHLRDCATDGSTWKQMSDLLPDLLAREARITPELSELAKLERAMRQAFEAGEPVARSRHALHPSVSLLVFRQNTPSLWSALICGENPPRPYALDQPQHVIVWRHKGVARMRLLGEEEYLCMAGLLAKPKMKTVAAQMALPLYVAGWVESEVVVAAPV